MKTFTATELDQLASDLNRDGICVLRGLFDEALIAEWNRAFTSLFRDRAAIPGGLAPREKNRFYMTLPWIAPFADARVFANPAILGVLDRVLAQEYVMCQLATDTPLKDSEYQNLHRDFRPLFSDEFPTPLYALAVNFPLVEVTAERGPFQMVRGTHRMPPEKAQAKIAAGELAVESFLMKPGDVMIRTPLALHRGSPNTTDVPRPMVVMGYVMHWLHTAKTDLMVPRAYYESLPLAQRALLRCEVVESLPAFRPENYLEFKY